MEFPKDWRKQPLWKETRKIFFFCKSIAKGKGILYFELLNEEKLGSKVFPIY